MVVKDRSYCRNIICICPFLLLVFFKVEQLETTGRPLFYVFWPSVIPCGAYFFRVLICAISALFSMIRKNKFPCEIWLCWLLWEFYVACGKEKTLKTKRNMGVNQSFWPHEGKKFNVIQNDLEFSVCSNGCFDKIATWTRPLGALQRI